MIRIDWMSVVKKCFKTIEPKLPVPPVITNVFPLKASVICILFLLFQLYELSPAIELEGHVVVGLKFIEPLVFRPV